MRIPERIRKLLLRWVLSYCDNTLPNRRIPPEHDKPTYMLRWWLWRNRFTSCYINEMHRSDDDRALHDHPWANISIVLGGGYWEHMPTPTYEIDGSTRRVWRNPGEIIIRRKATYLHRLELTKISRPGDEVTAYHPAVSIFIMGPRRRRWGFFQPGHGWVDARVWDDHHRELFPPKTNTEN